MNLTMLALGLIGGLAVLGLLRGVRAEGLTLAGILAASMVFANQAGRAAIGDFLNRVPESVQTLVAPQAGPAPVILQGPDHQLMMGLVFFLAAVAFFYWVGFRFGGWSGGGLERLLGGVLGGLTGFVIASTLFGFSQDYLSRNANVQPLSVAGITAPALPATNTLASYAPAAFAAAIGIVALLMVIRVVRR